MTARSPPERRQSGGRGGGGGGGGRWGPVERGIECRGRARAAKRNNGTCEG